MSSQPPGLLDRPLPRGRSVRARLPPHPFPLSLSLPDVLATILCSPHPPPPPVVQTVSLSSVVFLLSEFIQYNKGRVNSIAELEERLMDLGKPVGLRFLELLGLRDKRGMRETKILGILTMIHTQLWTTMFGRKADSIEKGTDHTNDYMVNDKEVRAKTKKGRLVRRCTLAGTDM